MVRPTPHLPPQMSRVFNSPIRVFALWMLACLLTYSMLDVYATRPVPVYVSEYSDQGLDDEQALVQAIQEADQLRDNGWWMHDKQPYLVLDAATHRNIDPAFLADRAVHVRAQGDRLIGVLAPVTASIMP